LLDNPQSALLDFIRQAGLIGRFEQTRAEHLMNAGFACVGVVVASRGILRFRFLRSLRPALKGRGFSPRRGRAFRCRL
jgi:hypothetical protein